MTYVVHWSNWNFHSVFKDRYFPDKDSRHYVHSVGGVHSWNLVGRKTTIKMTIMNIKIAMSMRIKRWQKRQLSIFSKESLAIALHYRKLLKICSVHQIDIDLRSHLVANITVLTSDDNAPLCPWAWQHKSQLDHPEPSKAIPGSNSFIVAKLCCAPHVVITQCCNS